MRRFMKKILVVDNEATGEYARNSRKRYGISMRSVARDMGISANYLSLLETGQRRFSQARFDDFFNSLASHLHISSTPENSSKNKNPQK